MTDEDIRKLLGGYATHTLSEGEEQALFEAALHDDKLFAALADEHALREMLDDPGNRAAMLQALQPAPRRVFRWMLPVWAAAGVVVVATVTFVYQRQQANVPVEMAKVVRPSLPASPALDRAAESAPQQADEPLAASKVAGAPRPNEQIARQPIERELLRDRREMKAEISAPEPESSLKERRAAAPLAVPPPPPSQAAAPAGAVAGSDSSVRRAGGAASESVTVQADTALVPSSAGLAARAKVSPLTYGAGKVQYSISKQGPDGEFKKVDVNTVLQPADTVRLTVEADESGYLAVSQKEPRKMLYQGAIQKQMPVIVPLTGKLGPSSYGALQIQFMSPALANGDKNGFLPERPFAPGSVSSRKALSESDVQKTQTQQQNGSKDQLMRQDRGTGTITLDVNLNVAQPTQQNQQKK